MKLLCTLAPRSDGTIIYADGKTRYVFAADAEGSLVCDVPDDAVVAKMLALPHFEPADEGDYDQAEALLQAQAVALSGDAADGSIEDDEAEFFDEVVNGGLPVEGAAGRVAPQEAATPPAAKPARKAARATRSAATA